MAIKFLSTVAVDTNVLYVDAAANKVGIGTTSPSAKLHVQGGSSGYLFRVQGTSTLNVYDPGAAAEIGVGSGSGDKLKLFSNDSINNGITIDTTGNVGIGTTSPKAKLDVAGGVKVANDTDTATADKEGTLRYRLAPDVPKSQSMVDMCMKTGPSSYAWVNIVTNTWNN